jgi:hypothetical protein
MEDSHKFKAIVLRTHPMMEISQVAVRLTPRSFKVKYELSKFVNGRSQNYGNT